MGPKKEAKHEQDIDQAANGDDRELKDHGAPRGAASLACKRALRDLIRWADVGIDLSMRCFHIFMKILGPCLVCLALSLISFCTYAFFVHFLPSTSNVLGLPSQVLLSAIGLFLEFNALYNYGKSIFMDPGMPPEYEQALKEWEEHNEELAKPKPKQCKRCSRLKPPRCHHCSVCRQCVLKMDHHCPWINNCVGHRNYKHFCLFLLYLTLVCLFIVLCFFQPFSEMIFFMRRRSSRLTRNGRQCIMSAFMVCCSILIALSILGGFHAYLVLTNQTTIEFQTNLARRREARKNGEFFRNPYDLGRTRNFQQVFGPNQFCRFKWMLPWALGHQSYGDGLSYPSIRMSE